ncbi:MAG: DNA (cytosine-5-)-methyltransferase [Phycisphaerae bacterium]|nr:DNA (cytosine-5-)-methyltransferase [Phycisphaerae bacterium]
MAELYCGPGGLAWGAKNAVVTDRDGRPHKIQPVWANDIDQQACATYALNIHDGDSQHVTAGPIQRIDLNAIPRIDGLAFGFPCNDFSIVGEQKGINGTFGPLYSYGVKVLDLRRPLWFVAENVSGIGSANSGDTFKEILQRLNTAGTDGYNLTVHLFKFEEYGIPQYRHRYFIVGIRRTGRHKHLKFRVPKPTHTKTNFLAVSEALLDIGTQAPHSELTRQDRRVELRLKFTPPWKNAWFLEELRAMCPAERSAVLKSLPWYAQEFAGVSDSRICELIDEARLHCTKAKMSHIYRRLDPHRPSYTITGSGGGGTHVYHWAEHRALTNRERARLQTFPNHFVFIGTKEQIRKQIGMAVPPDGAKIVFNALLNTLAGQPYPSVPPSYGVF